MDGYWVFIICIAVAWALLALGDIARHLGGIKENSRRTAVALELLAQIANIKRGA